VSNSECCSGVCSGGICGGGGDPCADLTDCSACSSQSECLTCCDDSLPAANDALIGYLIQECICAGAAPCAAACAVNGQPSPACQDPTAQTSQACVNCVNALTSAAPCIQKTSQDC